MSARSGAFWIHVAGEKEERLFQIRDMGLPGHLDLAGCGHVEIHIGPNGEKKVGKVDGNLHCSIFSDGALLLKKGHRLAAVRPTRKSSRFRNASILSGLLTVTVALALAFDGNRSKLETQTPVGARSRSVARTKAEKKLSSRQPVVAEAATIAKPSKTDSSGSERKVMKTAKLKPKKAGPPRLKVGTEKAPWDSIERKVREHFLHGEFAKALAEVSEIRLDAGSAVPGSLRKVSAEVNYAVCLRAFTAQKWREAVVYCERAGGLSIHERASHVLDELADRSRRLYLEGYVMEKTNRSAAVRRYREALASAPTDSEFQRKASRKLKSFQERRYD